MNTDQTTWNNNNNTISKLTSDRILDWTLNICKLVKVGCALNDSKDQG